MLLADSLGAVIQDEQQDDDDTVENVPVWLGKRQRGQGIAQHRHQKGACHSARKRTDTPVE